KREYRVYSRAAVVEKHEHNHRQHSRDRSCHSLADRVRAKRWTHRSLFKVDSFCGKRSGSQHQREIFGGLLSEVPGYLTAIGNLAVNARRRLDLIVQDNCELVTNVFAGRIAESSR